MWMPAATTSMCDVVCVFVGLLVYVFVICLHRGGSVFICLFVDWLGYLFLYVFRPFVYLILLLFVSR